MKRLLYIVMLLLPMVAYANGDPTAEFCALTLSKTPVPRAIPEIQIERENLHVVLDYGQARIKVDYVLHNTSDQSFDKIYYGFPIDWYGDSLVHWVGDLYSEKQYQKGWSNDYVRDFSFSLDGVSLSAHMSGDTVLRPTYTNMDWHRDFGYPDVQNFQYDSVHHSPENWEDSYNNYEYVLEYEWEGMPTEPLVLEESLHRRWYYTSFSIIARQTVTLHVEYVLSHTMRVALSSLGEEFQSSNGSYNHFSYDLSPAAAWGDGTTRELDITIEAPDTKVWSADQSWWKDSCLFEGHYHQHYTDFQYATAEPLEFTYLFSMPDSLDVNAIRDHRLSPLCYTILQHENDTCSYAALSDLDGCTGVFLKPTNSGDYVLDIVLPDTIPLTGIAILNGQYCDLDSWQSTPRAEKMLVKYWRIDSWNPGLQEYSLYGTQEWVVRYIKANYHPTLCKSDQPADFTWPSLVKAMEKMNIRNRGFETPYGWDNLDLLRVYRIRIQIPRQESAPYISEIILLSTRKSSCK